MKLSKQDQNLMAIAFEISATTDDPKAEVDSRAAVGAVVSLEGKVISKSANRLLPALRGEYKLTDPSAPERYYLLEHAERCAIYDAAIANIPLVGATIYCTRFPCLDCARTIAYFGLRRVVVAAGYSADRKWASSQRAALCLLRQIGITVRYLPG